MTQTLQEIQPIVSADVKHSHRYWAFIPAAMLALGSFMAIYVTWGDNAPWFIPGLIFVLFGCACLAGSAHLRKKYRAARFLWLLPYLALLVLGRPSALLNGTLLWCDTMITHWNYVNNGGVSLFPAEMHSHDVGVFCSLAACISGQVACWAAHHYRRVAGALLCLFWLWVQLLGAQYSSLSCALLLAGVFLLWCSERTAPPAAHIAASCLLYTALLLAGALLLPHGEVAAVYNLRQNVKSTVTKIRYGEETLPHGDLNRADTLQKGSDRMLTVTSGQQKALYLRAYTGAVYDSGCWEPLPGAAYGGDNAGMLSWLDAQGFDPLTQAAQYYSLCQDAPEANTVGVTVHGASRSTYYAPATMQAAQGKAPYKEKKDAYTLGKGLFGCRSAAFDEISDQRPAELTVAENWLQDPQTEEQRRYAQAEAVYRTFVYSAYNTQDATTYTLMQQIFWQDYESDSDGVFSAISHIREVLKDRVRYTETPAAVPEGEDPIRYFLLESHQGNSMLYAAATVQALRAHNIPARYAEGYYLSAEALSSGTADVTQQDAHAWVEVYFDGIGWLPLDTTPGYYYETVALQQMVAAPDAVRKTAAVQDNTDDAAQLQDGNGTAGGGQTVLPQMVIRNMPLVLLGLLALVLLFWAFRRTFSVFLRAALIRFGQWRYAHATPQQRVVLLEKWLYYVLGRLGIEATLGWRTKETAQAVAQAVPGVREDDFIRAVTLLEKFVYGGAEPAVHEERALRTLLEKMLMQCK